MRIKIELYILSLFLLFFLLFFSKATIFYEGDNCWELLKGYELLKANWIPIICIVGMGYGAFIYHRFNNTIMDSSKVGPWKVEKVEGINFENLSFLATFIIPLLCFDLDFNLSKGRNAFMLLLVILAIGIVYIKANFYYTNPSLAIINFKIYKITYSFQGKEKKVLILTKDKIKEGDKIFSKYIDDNIYYSRKSKTDE